MSSYEQNDKKDKDYKKKCYKTWKRDPEVLYPSETDTCTLT